MKDSLFSGFAISSLIHAALIPTASLLIAGTRPAVPTQRIEVSLTDISKADQAEPTPAPETLSLKRSRRSRHPSSFKKTELARVEPSQPPPKLEQLPPPPELDRLRSRERQRRQQSARRRGSRRRGGCRWSVWRRRRRGRWVAAAWAEAAAVRRLPD